jgi:hypothetical protein
LEDTHKDAQKLYDDLVSGHIEQKNVDKSHVS